MRVCSCARRSDELGVDVNRRHVLAACLSAAVLVVAACSREAARPPAAIPTPSTAASAAPEVEASSDPTMPAPNPGARPTENEAIAAVKQFVFDNSNDVVVASVEDLKMAQDSQGRWWVTALAIPAARDVDACYVFMYKDGDQWVMTDLGTGIDASELPADVRDRL